MKRLLLLIVLLSQLAPTAMGQGASVPCDALEKVVNAQRRATLNIVNSHFTSDTGTFIPVSVRMLYYVPADSMDAWFEAILRFSTINSDFQNNGLRGDDQQWAELIAAGDTITALGNTLDPHDFATQLLVEHFGSHVLAYQSFRELADLFDAHCPFVNPVQRLFATPSSQ